MRVDDDVVRLPRDVDEMLDRARAAARASRCVVGPVRIGEDFEAARDRAARALRRAGTRRRVLVKIGREVADAQPPRRCARASRRGAAARSVRESRRGPAPRVGQAAAAASSSSHSSQNGLPRSAASLELAAMRCQAARHFGQSHMRCAQVDERAEQRVRAACARSPPRALRRARSSSPRTWWICASTLYGAGSRRGSSSRAFCAAIARFVERAGLEAGVRRARCSAAAFAGCARTTSRSCAERLGVAAEREVAAPRGARALRHATGRCASRRSKHARARVELALLDARDAEVVERVGVIAAARASTRSNSRAAARPCARAARTPCRDRGARPALPASSANRALELRDRRRRCSP